MRASSNARVKRVVLLSSYGAVGYTNNGTGIVTESEVFLSRPPMTEQNVAGRRLRPIPLPTSGIEAEHFPRFPAQFPVQSESA
jgi:hypothetical protein